MQPSYLPTNQNITRSRLNRFAAYRSSLSEDERKALDAKLARWRVAIAGERKIGFGPLGVQELFMALAEFCDRKGAAHE